MSTFDRQNLKKTPRRGLRVSDHAMIRFRERVEEEFLSRSDADLADLLNDRVKSAILTREVVDPREPRVPTTLHLFEGRTGARLVAVVREKCVVTVLEDWMARNNYPGWEDGQVTAPAAAALSLPLGDKLRGLAIVPSTSPPVASAIGVAAPAPLPPPPPLPDPYGDLAAECRALGQRLRSLRDRRGEIDAEIEVVLSEYEEKRGRLIAIMDEGAP